MTAERFDLGNGTSINVDVEPAKGGTGYKVAHSLIVRDGVAAETTVTCTCGTGANQKTVTKSCPGTGNTCDCSDPANPKITCG